MILDPASDRLDVRRKLERMLGKMDDFQKLAFTYKAYQKNFKVLWIYRINWNTLFKYEYDVFVVYVDYYPNLFHTCIMLWKNGYM